MIEIDATLVKQLIRTQYPQWAAIPVAQGAHHNGATARYRPEPGKECAPSDPQYSRRS